MSEEKNQKQKDKKSHYLSRKESREIAKNNKKAIRELEKNKHRHMAESEFTTVMKDEKNIVEFDNLIHISLPTRAYPAR